MRLIGTDWLVRLVRPRVIRSPRGDSARVKLNIEITRRLIMVTAPIAIGIKAPRANLTTPNCAVTTSTTTMITSESSHSDESRKPTINRCGRTLTSGRSVDPRSVNALAGAP